MNKVFVQNLRCFQRVFLIQWTGVFKICSFKAAAVLGNALPVDIIVTLPATMWKLLRSLETETFSTNCFDGRQPLQESIRNASVENFVIAPSYNLCKRLKSLAMETWQTEKDAYVTGKSL